MHLVGPPEMEAIRDWWCAEFADMPNREIVVLEQSAVRFRCSSQCRAHSAQQPGGGGLYNSYNTSAQLGWLDWASAPCLAQFAHDMVGLMILLTPVEWEEYVLTSLLNKIVLGKFSIHLWHRFITSVI